MRRILKTATVEEPPEPVRIKPPRLGSLDEIDLPVNLAPVKREPVREEVLTSSEGLDNLTDMSIEKIKEILKLGLDPDDDNFSVVLRQQSAVSIGVITAQVRVDEGRFKKKQVDKLGELLDLIRGEEARQVPVRVLN